MAELAAGLVTVVGPRKVLVVAPGMIFTPEEARQMAQNLVQAASAAEAVSPLLIAKGPLAS